MPRSEDNTLSKDVNASRPPADAPIPTTGKELVSLVETSGSTADSAEPELWSVIFSFEFRFAAVMGVGFHLGCSRLTFGKLHDSDFERTPGSRIIVPNLSLAGWSVQWNETDAPGFAASGSNCVDELLHNRRPQGYDTVERDLRLLATARIQRKQTQQ